MSQPSRQIQRRVQKITYRELEDIKLKHYKEGFKAGKEISVNVDFRILLASVLNNTPGIGPKRYETIMKVAKERIGK